MRRRITPFAFPLAFALLVLTSCATGPDAPGTTGTAGEVEELQTRVAELEDSLEQAHQERDSAREEASNVFSQLQEAENSNATLDSRLTDVRAQISALRATQEELADRAEGATVEAETLALENENLIDRVADLEQTIDELLVTQLTFFTQERLLYEDSKYDDLDLPGESDGDGTSEGDGVASARGTGSRDTNGSDNNAGTGSSSAGENDSGANADGRDQAPEPTPFSTAFLRGEFDDAEGAPIIGSRLDSEPLAGAVRVAVSLGADGTSYFYDNRIKPDQDHLTLVVERRQGEATLYIQLARVVNQSAAPDNGTRSPDNLGPGTLYAELESGDRSLLFDNQTARIDRIRVGTVVTERIRRPVDDRALSVLTNASRGAPVSVTYRTASGTFTHTPDQTERLAMVNMLYVFGELGGILPAVAAE